MLHSLTGKNSFRWHEQRKYQWFFSTYLFDRENVLAVLGIHNLYYTSMASVVKDHFKVYKIGMFFFLKFTSFLKEIVVSFWNGVMRRGQKCLISDFQDYFTMLKKFLKKKTFKKIDIGLETQLLELTNWTFNLETICVVKIAELTQYLSARPFKKTSKFSFNKLCHF